MLLHVLQNNLPLVVVVLVAAAAVFYLWRQLGEARRELLGVTKEECTGPLCDKPDAKEDAKARGKADPKADRKRVRFSDQEDGPPEAGQDPGTDRAPEFGEDPGVVAEGVEAR